MEISYEFFFLFLIKLASGFSDKSMIMKFDSPLIQIQAPMSA